MQGNTFVNLSIYNDTIKVYGNVKRTHLKEEIEMKDTYNLFIKREDGSEYDTIDTSNLYHAGDPIWLDGEKWIVVTGKVLPTRR